MGEVATLKAKQLKLVQLIATLQVDKDDLEDEVDGFEDELKIFKDKAKADVDEIRKLRKEVKDGPAKLRKAAAAHAADVEKLQAELRAAKKSTKTLEKQVRKGDQALADEERDDVEAELSIEELRAEKKETKAALKAAEHKAQAAEAAHKDELAALRKELEAKSGASSPGADKEVKALKKTVAAAEASLGDEREKHEAQLEASAADLVGLRSKYDTLEPELEETKKLAAAAKSDLAEATTALAAAEQKAERAAAQVTDLKDAKKRLAEEAEADHDRTEARIQAAHGAQESAEKRLKEREAEKLVRVQKIADLEHAAEGHAEALEELEVKWQKSRKELEAMTGDLKSSTEAVRGAKDDESTATAERDAADKRLEALKAEHAAKVEYLETQLKSARGEGGGTDDAVAAAEARATHLEAAKTAADTDADATVVAAGKTGKAAAAKLRAAETSRDEARAEATKEKAAAAAAEKRATEATEAQRALKAQVAALTAQLKEEEAESDAHKAHFEEATARASDGRKSLESQLTETKRRATETEALRTQISEAAHEKDALKAELAETQARLGAAEKKAQPALDARAAQESELKRLKGLVDSHVDESANLQAQLERLDDENDALEAKLAGTKPGGEKKAALPPPHDPELDALRSTVKSLEREKKDNAEEIASLAKANAALKAKSDSLSGADESGAANAKKAEAAEKRVKDLEASETKLEAAVDAAHARHARLKKEMDSAVGAYEDRIDKLSEEAKAAALALAEGAAKTEQLTKDLSSEKAASAKAAGDLVALRKEGDDAAAALATAKAGAAADVLRQKADLEAAEARIAAAAGAQEATEKESARLKADLAALEKTAQASAAEAAKAKSKTADLETRLERVLTKAEADGGFGAKELDAARQAESDALARLTEHEVAAADGPANMAALQRRLEAANEEASDERERSDSLEKKLEYWSKPRKADDPPPTAEGAAAAAAAAASGAGDADAAAKTNRKLRATLREVETALAKMSSDKGKQVAARETAVREAKALAEGARSATAAAEAKAADLEAQLKAQREATANAQGEAAAAAVPSKTAPPNPDTDHPDDRLKAESHARKLAESQLGDLKQRLAAAPDAHTALAEAQHEVAVRDKDLAAARETIAALEAAAQADAAAVAASAAAAAKQAAEAAARDAREAEAKRALEAAVAAAASDRKRLADIESTRESEQRALRERVHALEAQALSQSSTSTDRQAEAEGALSDKAVLTKALEKLRKEHAALEEARAAEADDLRRARAAASRLQHDDADTRGRLERSTSALRDERSRAEEAVTAMEGDAKRGRGELAAARRRIALLGAQAATSANEMSKALAAQQAQHAAEAAGLRERLSDAAAAKAASAAAAAEATAAKAAADAKLGEARADAATAASWAAAARTEAAAESAKSIDALKRELGEATRAAEAAQRETAARKARLDKTDAGDTKAAAAADLPELEETRAQLEALHVTHRVAQAECASARGALGAAERRAETAEAEAARLRDASAKAAAAASAAAAHDGAAESAAFAKLVAEHASLRVALQAAERGAAAAEQAVADASEEVSTAARSHAVEKAALRAKLSAMQADAALGGEATGAAGDSEATLAAQRDAAEHLARELTSRLAMSNTKLGIATSRAARLGEEKASSEESGALLVGKLEAMVAELQHAAEASAKAAAAGAAADAAASAAARADIARLEERLAVAKKGWLSSEAAAAAAEKRRVSDGREANIQAALMEAKLEAATGAGAEAGVPPSSPSAAGADVLRAEHRAAAARLREALGRVAVLENETREGAAARAAAEAKADALSASAAAAERSVAERDDLARKLAETHALLAASAAREAQAHDAAVSEAVSMLRGTASLTKPPQAGAASTPPPQAGGAASPQAGAAAKPTQPAAAAAPPPPPDAKPNAPPKSAVIVAAWRSHARAAGHEQRCAALTARCDEARGHIDELVVQLEAKSGLLADAKSGGARAKELERAAATAAAVAAARADAADRARAACEAERDEARQDVRTARGRSFQLVHKAAALQLAVGAGRRALARAAAKTGASEAAGKAAVEEIRGKLTAERKAGAALRIERDAARALLQEATDTAPPPVLEDTAAAPPPPDAIPEKETPDRRRVKLLTAVVSHKSDRIAALEAQATALEQRSIGSDALAKRLADELEVAVDARAALARAKVLAEERAARDAVETGVLNARDLELAEAAAANAFETKLRAAAEARATAAEALAARAERALAEARAAAEARVVVLTERLTVTAVVGDTKDFLIANATSAGDDALSRADANARLASMETEVLTATKQRIAAESELAVLAEEKKLVQAQHRRLTDRAAEDAETLQAVGREQAALRAGRLKVVSDLEAGLVGANDALAQSQRRSADLASDLSRAVSDRDRFVANAEKVCVALETEKAHLANAVRKLEAERDEAKASLAALTGKKRGGLFRASSAASAPAAPADDRELTRLAAMVERRDVQVAALSTAADEASRRGVEGELDAANLRSRLAVAEASNARCLRAADDARAAAARAVEAAAGHRKTAGDARRERDLAVADARAAAGAAERRSEAEAARADVSEVRRQALVEEARAALASVWHDLARHQSLQRKAHLAALDHATEVATLRTHLARARGGEELEAETGGGGMTAKAARANAANAAAANERLRARLDEIGDEHATELSAENVKLVQAKADARAAGARTDALQRLVSQFTAAAGTAHVSEGGATRRPAGGGGGDSSGPASVVDENDATTATRTEAESRGAADLAFVRDELSTLRAEHERHAAETHDRAAELYDEVEALKKQLRASRAQVDDYRAVASRLTEYDTDAAPAARPLSGEGASPPPPRPHSNNGTREALEAHVLSLETQLVEKDVLQDEYAALEWQHGESAKQVATLTASLAATAAASQGSEELRARCADLEAVVDSTHDRHKRLETTHAEYVEGARAALVDKDAAIAALAEALSDVACDATASTKNANDARALKRAVVAKDAQHAAAVDGLARAWAACAASDAARDAARAELGAVQAALEAAVAKAKDEKLTGGKREGRLKAELTARDEKLSMLQWQADEHTETTDRLKADREALDAAHSARHETVSSVAAAKEEALRVELEAIRKDSVEMREGHSELEKRYAALADRDASSTQLQEHMQQLADSVAAVHAAQLAAAQEEASLAGLRAADFEAEATALRKASRARTGELVQAEGLRAGEKESVGEMRNAVADLRRDKRMAEVALASARGRLSEMEALHDARFQQVSAMGAALERASRGAAQSQKAGAGPKPLDGAASPCRLAVRVVDVRHVADTGAAAGGHYVTLTVDGLGGKRAATTAKLKTLPDSPFEAVAFEAVAFDLDLAKMHGAAEVRVTAELFVDVAPSKKGALSAVAAAVLPLGGGGRGPKKTLLATSLVRVALHRDPVVDAWHSCGGGDGEFRVVTCVRFNGVPGDPDAYLEALYGRNQHSQFDASGVLVAADPAARRAYQSTRSLVAAREKRQTERWEAHLRLSYLAQRDNAYRLADLAWDGVPTSLRRDAYMLLANIESKMEAAPVGYYTTLIDRSEGLHNSAIARVIDRDVETAIGTDSHTVLSTTEGKAELTNVLRAYALRNTTLGFFQPIAHIAARLCSGGFDQYTVFWVLATLCEETFAGYFSDSMAGLQTALHVLEDLVAYRLPALHEHLADLDCPVDVLALPWLHNIFSTALPPDTAVRVLDAILRDGGDVAVSVALTLFRELEADLLRLRDLRAIQLHVDAAVAAMYDCDRLVALARAEHAAVKSRIPGLRKTHATLIDEKAEKALKADTLQAVFASSVDAKTAEALYEKFMTYGIGDLQAAEYRVLDRDGFVSVMSESYPAAGSAHVEALFDAFDADGDGTLDSKEFSCFLGVVVGDDDQAESGEGEGEGDIDAKLRRIFNAFDRDRGGTIDNHELHVLFSTLYRLSGKTMRRASINALADRAMAELDSNADGVLSFDEFKEIAKVAPAVLEAIVLHIPRLMGTLGAMEGPGGDI